MCYVACYEFILFCVEKLLSTPACILYFLSDHCHYSEWAMIRPMKIFGNYEKSNISLTSGFSFYTIN